jgi:hypothetical protein
MGLYLLLFYSIFLDVVYKVNNDLLSFPYYILHFCNDYKLSAIKYYNKIKSPQTLEEIEESIKYIVNNNIKTEYLENYLKKVFIRGNHFIKNVKTYCPIFYKLVVVKY